MNLFDWLYVINVESLYSGLTHAEKLVVTPGLVEYTNWI